MYTHLGILGDKSRGFGGGCGDVRLLCGAAAGHRQSVGAALQQVLPVHVGRVVLVLRLMAVQVVRTVVVLPILNTRGPPSTN